MRSFLQAILLSIAMLLTTAGCNSFDASRWGQAEVTKEINDQWHLTDVRLSQVADGFEGTGKDASGETFKIKVKLDPKAKSAVGTADGDRGSSLSFSAKPK